MKSLIYLVNTMGGNRVHGGVEFAPGTPTLVFRKKALLESREVAGDVAQDARGGILVGIDFDGNNLTPSECEATLMGNFYEYTQSMDRDDAFSDGWYWNKATCEALIDGLKRQMDAFNWDAATIKRDDFFVTAHTVMTALLAGYLDVAKTLLAEVPAEESPEFFTALRKGQFAALFDSALE